MKKRLHCIKHGRTHRIYPSCEREAYERAAREGHKTSVPAEVRTLSDEGVSDADGGANPVGDSSGEEGVAQP